MSIGDNGGIHRYCSHEYSVSLFNFQFFQYKYDHNGDMGVFYIGRTAFIITKVGFNSIFNSEVRTILDS